MYIIHSDKTNYRISPLFAQIESSLDIANTDADNEVTSFPAESIKYMVGCQLGSTRVMLDGNGDVDWFSDYEPFGQNVSEKNFDEQTTTDQCFTSYTRDIEIGMHYAMNRYMDSSLGRFISEDPAKDGQNWWIYAANNPLKFIDPTGLDIILLNDSDAVRVFGEAHGHNAVLVGNDQDGWTYYSKDGYASDQKSGSGSSSGAGAKDSPATFEPDGSRNRGGDEYTRPSEIKTWNIKDPSTNYDKTIEERYDRSVRIPTTKEQDKIVKEYADSIYTSDYNLFNNNCADQAKDILNRAGVSTGNDKWGTITDPNKQYANLEKEYGPYRPPNTDITTADEVNQDTKPERLITDPAQNSNTNSSQTGSTGTQSNPSEPDAPSQPTSTTSDDDNISEPDAPSEDPSEEVSDSDDDESTIICTELHRQGLMEEWIYRADAEFGKYIKKNKPNALIGYHKIARPIVKLMRQSKFFTHFINIFAKPWSYEMAYRTGARNKGDLGGKIIMSIGVPLCGTIGFLTNSPKPVKIVLFCLKLILLIISGFIFLKKKWIKPELNKYVLFLCMLFFLSKGAFGMGIYELDKKEVKLAVCNSHADVYIYKGKSYDISKKYEKELKEKKFYGGAGCREMFFIDDKILCLVIFHKIIFFDTEKLEEIRVIELNDYTFATLKNKEKKEIFILSGGFIYEYDLNKDEIVKRTILMDYKNYGHNYDFLVDSYPSSLLPTKLTYSQKRNSIFYLVEHKKKGKRHTYIYELNMNDYSIAQRFEGNCPEVKNGKLYYISADDKKLVSVDEETLSDEHIEFEYELPFYFYAMADNGLLLFVHRAKRERWLYPDTYNWYYKVRDVNGRVKKLSTKGFIQRWPFDILAVSKRNEGSPVKK